MSKKARKVKATFEIREDYDNAGVAFYTGGKITHWNELTYKEQVKMLNAWVGMYRLFYKHVKED